MQETAMKWAGRALRVLGVRPRACERNVNDLRARVGVPNWVVQRALVAQRARRAAVATALPLPRGRVWGMLGWGRDLRHELHDHAFYSGCLAYTRDPRFFDRPTWPEDLLHIMAPAPDFQRALWISWATVMALATARTSVRQLARRLTRSRLAALALLAGAAALWGAIEARVTSARVVKGVERYLAHGAPQGAPPAGARVIHFDAAGVR